MKLYVKQKLFSLFDNFSIMDEDRKSVFMVEGNYLASELTITDLSGHPLAKISKKLLSFIPKFTISIDQRRSSGSQEALDSSYGSLISKG